MSQVTVMYPGTFDPFTLGHGDLVERAAQQFERVVVAVAGSTSKQTLFSVEERMELVRQVLADLNNIEVITYNGLTIEAAKAAGATVILRGLRAVSDFEYELQLATMNRRLCPDLDTMFLTPALQYGHLSSSLVREIARLGGNISEFVHPAVLSALQKKLRK